MLSWHISLVLLERSALVCSVFAIWRSTSDLTRFEACCVSRCGYVLNSEEATWNLMHTCHKNWEL